VQHLNYQHLRYFWVTAREGSITAAAKTLGLSASTISIQLKQLENQCGQALFDRVGRGLELTEVGEVTFRYADAIFNTGEELKDYLEGRRVGGPLRLHVGVSQVFPKLVTWRLIEPATQMDAPCNLVVREASTQELIDELLLHQLDVILSDTPLRGNGSIRLHNKLLGETSVTLCASKTLAVEARGDFPERLSELPMLLPSSGAEMRRSLDNWLSENGVRPQVAAEFDDLALMKVAAEHGLGIAPVPTVILREACEHYGIEAIGEAGGVVEQFYAVSATRQVKHSAIDAIMKQAKDRLRA
jgi:LysR family transcriptional activator of nhaA